LTLATKKKEKEKLRTCILKTQYWRWFYGSYAAGGSADAAAETMPIIDPSGSENPAHLAKFLSLNDVRATGARRQPAQDWKTLKKKIVERSQKPE
jgi:hypothetical protein